MYSYPNTLIILKLYIYIPDTFGAINLHMPRVCHWIIEVGGWKSHIKFQYVNGNSCQYRSPSICPAVWCTRGETSTAVKMFWACDERKYTYYMIQWTFAFQLKLKSNEKINEKENLKQIARICVQIKGETWCSCMIYESRFRNSIAYISEGATMPVGRFVVGIWIRMKFNDIISVSIRIVFVRVYVMTCNYFHIKTHFRYCNWSETLTHVHIR